MGVRKFRLRNDQGCPNAYRVPGLQCGESLLATADSAHLVVTGVPAELIDEEVGEVGGDDQDRG